MAPDPAQDAQLTDTVPQEMLSPQFSMDGGSTWQPWAGSTPLGDIPSGDSVTVLIRGTVDPAATGSIVNTAVVSSPTFDPDLSNNTDTVEVPVGEEADPVSAEAGRSQTRPSGGPGDLYFRGGQRRPLQCGRCHLRGSAARWTGRPGVVAGQRSHLAAVEPNSPPGDFDTRGGQSGAAAGRSQPCGRPDHCQHGCRDQSHPGPGPQ